MSYIYSPLLIKVRKHDPKLSAKQVEIYHANAVYHSYKITIFTLLVAFGVKSVMGKEWLPWYMMGSGDATKLLKNFPFIEHD